MGGSMNGLTPIQSQLLTYIREFTVEAGHAPSFAEMSQALGRSKGNIHQIVESMELLGVIRRLPNQSRSIVLVERLDRLAPDLEAWARGHCRRTGISRHVLIERALNAYRAVAP